ncbi:MAG: family 20 glycosylhydrolase [Ginsengibacter sp.]
MKLTTTRYYIAIIVSIVFLLLHDKVAAQQKNISEKYPIIPFPTHLRPIAGTFTVNKLTQIITDKLFTNEAEYLQHLLQNATGYSINIGNNTNSNSNIIYLEKDDNINAEEGYTLKIHPNKIVLAAKDATGIFRGIETIRQLLPVSAESKATVFKNVTIPAAEINDEPLYSWRGMHLDVSRHFFSIDYLKKFIDVLALYKMNKLHLHLTDDQGWRIEIKKYPKLTEEGAWRTFNNQDSDCIRMSKDNPDMAIDTEHIIHRDGKTLYGGFYTQEQMKGLVAYAATRHIDIIPELDMPGHMMAAIHSYPFLSCDGGSQWGALFSTPICPCNESTFEFAENVYKEIFDIFPSEYVHLGADEVDRKEWAKSPACKELMEKEGLKDVDELQSYFVKRMEKFFNANGKKLIGWDEILEGGVSKTAYVMYWRSWVPTAPVKAAKNGNYVIMTPGNPLYFDGIPNANSVKSVYDFNVVPKGLNAEEAKFILGAQANIWTEHIPSENRADFMYMPRMTALAERLWSNTNDFDAYLIRLQHQYKRLDALKVHYRLPDLTGFSQENVFTDRTILTVTKPFQSLQIHYTTNDSIPEISSPILSKPLTINQPVVIKLAAFAINGLRGDIYTLNYKKEKYAIPVTVNTTLKNGLNCSYYKQFFKTSTALNTATADSMFTATDFVVPASVNAPSFGLQYKGFIDVPETGIYTFYLTCDDGGILTIANREVVNNDGLHSAIQKTGQVALQKGLQPFLLNFIEGGGGFTLQLKYSKDNNKPEDIPAGWLKY